MFDCWQNRVLLSLLMFTNDRWNIIFEVMTLTDVVNALPQGWQYESDSGILEFQNSNVRLET